MVNQTDAQLCLAYPLGASPGTRGTMLLAGRRGILVANRTKDEWRQPDPAITPAEETLSMLSLDAITGRSHG